MQLTAGTTQAHGKNGMKIWMIEYCDSEGIARDCYPDFCYSRSEAYRIGPKFLNQMAACGPDGSWAKSWRVIEIEEKTPPVQGERRHRPFRATGAERKKAALLSMSLSEGSGEG